MSLYGPVEVEELAAANVELRLENSKLRQKLRDLQEAGDLIADERWLGGMKSQLIAKRLEAGRLRRQNEGLRRRLYAIDEAVYAWEQERIDDETLIAAVVKAVTE